jgi:hypothetical protein
MAGSASPSTPDIAEASFAFRGVMMTLDTIRIACANAESDLAAELALHIPRAAEARA